VTIIEALRRTVELVQSSEGSGQAGDRANRLAQEIRDVIAALEAGSPVDRWNLRVLFAPTGPVQDASLANGWGDEFLSLAEIVDAFVANG
jgi:hypothetical protein